MTNNTQYESMLVPPIPGSFKVNELIIFLFRIGVIAGRNRMITKLQFISDNATTDIPLDNVKMIGAKRNENNETICVVFDQRT